MGEEGAPRARGEPAAATGGVSLPGRGGQPAGAAASKPAATASAEAAACQAATAAAVAGTAVTEARWLAMGTADPHGVGGAFGQGAYRTVTAVEQVIPAHALVTVGKWRRQLKRRLRAVARSGSCAAGGS